jgi:hypothetical protein
MKANWGSRLPVFLAAVGAVVVLLVELKPVAPGLREAALVVGGVLMGFISLWLDEAIRTGPQRDAERKEHAKERKEDQERANNLLTENHKLLAENEELHELAKASEARDRTRSEMEAGSAYGLAWIATTLPTKTHLPNATDLFRSMCSTIESLSSDLGLRFSDDERQMLESPVGDLATARQISERVWTKARELPQRVWCFFELGNRTQWLRDQAKDAHSTKTAMDWLEAYRSDPYLTFAPHFAEVVDELIEVFRPYQNAVPEDSRESLVHRVGDAFDKIPSVYIQDRSIQAAYQRSPWFWVDDHGVGVITCILENPKAPERSFALRVRDANTYELSETEDDKTKSTRVTRDEAGWHCSAHTNASAENMCFEIQLVLEVTDGGNLPTKVKVIPVRSDPANPNPDSPSKDGPA